MHDPYASPGSGGSLPDAAALAPPPLSTPGASSPDDFRPAASGPADELFLNISSEKAPQPDFLFDESYDESFDESFNESFDESFDESFGEVRGLRSRPVRKQERMLPHTSEFFYLVKSKGRMLTHQRFY